jgi:hypothetical protein
MVGKTLLHYRIVKKIGAGGMGEAHRARELVSHACRHPQVQLLRQRIPGSRFLRNDLG